MDDLLEEFLIETNESLDVVDVELVRFEQEPNNAKILANIFRLVHTIKGTCGFLGLPRLEALAHAAETLMSKFRDGMPVTGEAVTLVLFAIDRIKDILAELEEASARARRRRHRPDPRSSSRWCSKAARRRPCTAGGRHAAPRRWSGRCARAKCRSTNWSARSAKRPGPVPRRAGRAKPEPVKACA